MQVGRLTNLEPMPVEWLLYEIAQPVFQDLSMPRSRLIDEIFEGAEKAWVVRLFDVALVPKARPTHKFSIKRAPQPRGRNWIDWLAPEVAEQRDCISLDNSAQAARSRFVVDADP
jgi:hypothetical protein